VEARRIRDTGGGMAKHRCIGLERWRHGGAGIRGTVDQSRGGSESRRRCGGAAGQKRIWRCARSGSQLASKHFYTLITGWFLEEKNGRPARYRDLVMPVSAAMGTGSPGSVA
jgi:hypothetical protein